MLALTHGWNAMSGFAGSGSLDDRRRRRLASSSDQPDTVRGSTAPEAGIHSVEADTSFDPGLVRLSDLTPRDIWKTAALISSVVFLAVAAVVASHDPALQAGQYGDAVTKFFDLNEGQAIRFLSIATLISAAHLALVIGTVRSHSPRDFRGTYRIWRWAAALFVGAAMLVGTDLHLVFSDLIRQWSGMTYHGWVHLNWLISLSIVATIITWKLWLDMKLSRPSIICLGLSVISALALMASDTIVAITGHAHIVLFAQLSLGVSLFAAMLLHVRFVSHVNPNPPEPKQTRPDLNPGSAARSKQATDGHPRAARSKQSALMATHPAAGTSAASYSDLDHDEAPNPRRSKKRIRHDGPEPNSLKGMSKKQRKQARKEFRERQRAMQQGREM